MLTADTMTTDRIEQLRREVDVTSSIYTICTCALFYGLRRDRQICADVWNARHGGES